jgi:simple sugar transport system permease protein
MSIAGALAGMGGGVEVLGITKNYPAEYIVNFGFDGLAVALLGRAHPIGVVGAALLFGVLRAGSGSMQRATDIPVDIIGIVQGVILFFVAAQIIIQRFVAPRGRRAQTAAAAA